MIQCYINSSEHLILAVISSYKYYMHGSIISPKQSIHLFIISLFCHVPLTVDRGNSCWEGSTVVQYISCQT